MGFFASWWHTPERFQFSNFESNGSFLFFTREHAWDRDTGCKRWAAYLVKSAATQWVWSQTSSSSQKLGAGGQKANFRRSFAIWFGHYRTNCSHLPAHTDARDVTGPWNNISKHLNSSSRMGKWGAPSQAAAGRRDAPFSSFMFAFSGSSGPPGMALLKHHADF